MVTHLHHHVPEGATPLVKGFWSLTLYNAEHFFHDNPLKRYSLGTKNKTLQYNADGSLTIYAGETFPGTDKETNWLPAPDGSFLALISVPTGRSRGCARRHVEAADH